MTGSGATSKGLRRPESARNSGFSLVELLIVVAVIGMLASMTLVALAGALDRARQHATMADMRSIARAMEAYSLDNHRLPDDTPGLAGLIGDMVPYAISVLPIKDHWGHDIHYAKDALDNYTLQSFGRDGVDGADLTRVTRFDYDLDLVMTNGIFVASAE